MIPHIIREATNVATPTEENNSDDSAVSPSASLSDVTVENEAVTLSKGSYLFQQRKTSHVRSMPMARVAGKRLLGVNYEDYEDDVPEEVVEAEKWELMLGHRVYSHDLVIELTSVPGEHPVRVGEVEGAIKAQNPEEVIVTLLDK